MQDISRASWLVRTLATLVGYTLGILAVLNPVVRLVYAEQLAWLIGLVGGAVLDRVIDAAQWLMLRRYTPVTGQWVLASSVGGALALRWVCRWQTRLSSHRSRRSGEKQPRPRSRGRWCCKPV